jgi:NaMN:DMB phosphoribosyltransferase
VNLDEISAATARSGAASPTSPTTETAQLETLSLGAGCSGARSNPDTLVILFCAYTGVRAAELAGLNVETCG